MNIDNAVRRVCIREMRSAPQGSWHVDNRDGDHDLVKHEAWELMAKAVRFLLFTTHSSRGMDGYHLNGDTAEWEEFEEFGEIENNRDALAKIVDYDE